MKIFELLAHIRYCSNWQFHCLRIQYFSAPILAHVFSCRFVYSLSRIFLVSNVGKTTPEDWTFRRNGGFKTLFQVYSSIWSPNFAKLCIHCSQTRWVCNTLANPKSITIGFDSTCTTNVSYLQDLSYGFLRSLLRKNCTPIRNHVLLTHMLELFSIILHITDQSILRETGSFLRKRSTPEGTHLHFQIFHWFVLAVWPNLVQGMKLLL